MYLFGASGHAKVVAEILKQLGIRLEGIIDDDKSLKHFIELKVKHSINSEQLPTPAIVSIGQNSSRKRIVERLQSHGVEFGKAIHPTAIISDDVKIGEGTVVMPLSVVQPGTNIGKHCIINTGAIIEHDCQIEDYAHISPNATLCGGITVGEGSWIGAGTTIIQGVKIGKWCVIGAGSVVTKDIPDGYVAYGTPCHRVRLVDEEKKTDAEVD